MSRLTQPVAHGGGPAVLPDDRGSQRLECAPVPDDQGLALVRDAHGPHVRRRGSGGLHGILRGELHRRPDLQRVVLDPPWLRKVLRYLAITLSAYLTIDTNHRGG